MMQGGLVPEIQGDSFASELSAIMEVAMLLVVELWSSLGLVSSYVVLVLTNEGGGPHHMQGLRT